MWDQRFTAHAMTTGVSPGDDTPDRSESAAETQRPDWADGLRQLYDSVVDEPLPDSFKDLLDQLDAGDASGSGCDADNSDESPG